MSLEKRTSGVEKADWPDETIQLTSQSVQVPAGITIHELLLAANIYPDVESFTLVYALNPELQDLRKLSIPRITIPKIEHGPKLGAVFERGFQVWLTVEKDKKQQLNESVQKLTTLIETVSNFEAVKFQNPAVRDEFLTSLKSSLVILDGIAEQVRERYGRTIPQSMLLELNAETELIIKIISHRLTGASKFNGADQELVKKIDEDLKRKARAFQETANAGDPSPQPDTIEVSVRTVRGGQLIPNLRIYYFPELTKVPVGKFGVLTTNNPNSPAKARVGNGDYCFWAVRDEAPDTRVTGEICRPLYLENKIELTVIR